MKKKILLVSALFFAILAGSYIFSFCQNYDAIANHRDAEEKKLLQMAEDTGTPCISRHQGIRTRHFSDYAVCDGLVFFSYREGSYIDAYDFSGAFQFAIILPDDNNGSVCVRCVDNQLYAKAKEHTVYVFEKDTLVETVPQEQAAVLGYSYQWFLSQPGYEIDKDGIYLLDDAQNRISEIGLPQTVQRNWPIMNLGGQTDQIIGITVLILIVVLWIISVALIIHSNRSKRKIQQYDRLPDKERKE